MTSKDRVLEAHSHYVGLIQMVGKFVLVSTKKIKVLGSGNTEDEAWDNAASRLPAGETASEMECPLCGGSGCGYCAQTGRYVDENDAVPEPAEKTANEEVCPDCHEKLGTTNVCHACFLHRESRETANAEKWERRAHIAKELRVLDCELSGSGWGPPSTGETAACVHDWVDTAHGIVQVCRICRTPRPLVVPEPMSPAERHLRGGCAEPNCTVPGCLEYQKAVPEPVPPECEHRFEHDRCVWCNAAPIAPAAENETAEFEKWWATTDGAGDDERMLKAWCRSAWSARAERKEGEALTVSHTKLIHRSTKAYELIRRMKTALEVVSHGLSHKRASSRKCQKGCKLCVAQAAVNSAVKFWKEGHENV
jgi:hypothetical protein